MGKFVWLHAASPGVRGQPPHPGFSARSYARKRLVCRQTLSPPNIGEQSKAFKTRPENIITAKKRPDNLRSSFTSMVHVVLGLFYFLI